MEGRNVHIVWKLLVEEPTTMIAHWEREMTDGGGTATVLWSWREGAKAETVEDDFEWMQWGDPRAHIQHRLLGHGPVQVNMDALGPVCDVFRTASDVGLPPEVQPLASCQQSDQSYTRHMAPGLWTIVAVTALEDTRTTIRLAVDGKAALLDRTIGPAFYGYEPAFMGDVNIVVEQARAQINRLIRNVQASHDINGRFFGLFIALDASPGPTKVRIDTPMGELADQELYRLGDGPPRYTFHIEEDTAFRQPFRIGLLGASVDLP